MRSIGENTQKVHDYFKAHAGKPVTTDKISEALLLPGWQVSNSCGVLLNRDRKLRRISTGVYEYRQSLAAALDKVRSGPQVGEITEVIGYDAEGNGISRGESGALYRLAPL